MLMTCLTDIQFFVKRFHWMMQFCSENIVFLVVKQSHTALTQASITYCKNIIGALFDLLKEVLNLTTTCLFFLTFQIPHFLIFLIKFWSFLVPSFLIFYLNFWNFLVPCFLIIYSNFRIFVVPCFLFSGFSWYLLFFMYELHFIFNSILGTDSAINFNKLYLKMQVQWVLLL